MRGLSETHNIWFGRVGELYVNNPFRLNYREPKKQLYLEELKKWNFFKYYNL